MNKEDLFKSSDYCFDPRCFRHERYNNLITKKDIQMMKKSALFN